MKLAQPLTLVFLALILLLQYPLWLGKGGWLRAWELSGQVDGQHERNSKLAARNAALDAEVRDLKQGLDAVEERARAQLGLIKPNEVFYQIIDQRRVSNPAPSPALAAPATQ